jgi:hypothetical protein
MSPNTPCLLLFSNLDGILLDHELFPYSPFGTVIAKSESYWKYSSGVSYHEFISALKDFGKILGWTIQGFSDMKEKLKGGKP